MVSLAFLAALPALLVALRGASERRTQNPSAASICSFPLYDPWKFHVGDDPRWAAPAFDDRRWVG
jgi:hypothetical protein